MKIKLLLLAATTWLACKSPIANQEEQLHAHNQPAMINYTLYSGNYELYVEFQPLVLNMPSEFVIHVTEVQGVHAPVRNAKVSVSLIIGKSGIKNIAPANNTGGIYKLKLRPEIAGKGRLHFSIDTDSALNFFVDDVDVYRDNKGLASLSYADEGEIRFAKESIWKTDFETQTAISRQVDAKIKVQGELLSKPGDEVSIASRSAGIVKFIGANILEGAAVRSGEKMFAVSGDNIVSENIDEQILQARLVANEAKAEFDRISSLMEDKLVLREEFQTAKLKHESAQLRLNNLLKNYTGGLGKSIYSPITGYIKEVKVSDGGFVSEGQPLATVFQNKRLLLKADVPTRLFERIAGVEEADFRVNQSDSVFNTRILDGKIVAIAKFASANNSFVPVFFEISNRCGLLPGLPAAIFLRLKHQKEKAIVMPSSCLLEEQGSYFVYVQKTGETFGKRNVKIGINDGNNAYITEGIEEGERVVTKGAYQVKLASQSTGMPVHDHHH